MIRLGYEEPAMPEMVRFGLLNTIPTAPARLQKVINLIKQDKPAVILLDGLGDLAIDPNSLAESQEVIGRLVTAAIEAKTFVFTTLHLNPVSPKNQSGKARGHLGSEAMRKASLVLQIERSAGYYALTTDFEFGKNRFGPPIAVGFQWDDSQKDFVSCEAPAPQGSKWDADTSRWLQNLSEETETKWTYTELIALLQKWSGESVPGIKRKIRFMVDGGLLEKWGSGKQARYVRKTQ